jgi:hypothetical protein
LANDHHGIDNLVLLSQNVTEYIYGHGVEEICSNSYWEIVVTMKPIPNRNVFIPIRGVKYSIDRILRTKKVTITAQAN